MTESRVLTGPLIITCQLYKVNEWLLYMVKRVPVTSAPCKLGTLQSRHLQPRHLANSAPTNSAHVRRNTNSAPSWKSSIFTLWMWFSAPPHPSPIKSLILLYYTRGKMHSHWHSVSGMSMTGAVVKQALLLFFATHKVKSHTKYKITINLYEQEFNFDKK